MRLEPGDVAEAIALEGVSRSTRKLLARDLPRAGHLWLGLRSGGRLVAVAGAIDGAGDAHVVEVTVAADRRRAGLATRLVAALLAACRDELGSTAATLEVRASNHAAQALYRRLGFTAAGLRPGYYDPEPGRDAEDEAEDAVAGGAQRSEHARREDAMVMWRHDLTDLVAPGGSV